MGLTIYGYRNGRTLRPLWALEEVSAPYDLIEVNIIEGEGRADWFRKLNPGGKVPVLVDGDVVICESAAICLYLADKFPEHALLPPVGTGGRAKCYQWISYLLTELDAPLWNIAKHRFALPPERRVPDAVYTATWEFSTAVRLLEQAIQDRAFLVEDWLTVADILAGHILLWATSARVMPNSQPLRRYLGQLTARPAYIRAQARARPANRQPAQRHRAAGNGDT
jgi:glutathione S-transferase